MPVRILNIPGASATSAILIDRALVGRLGTSLREQAAAADVLLVTDETVGGLYGQTALHSLEQAGFRVSLFSTPAGETSKSLALAGQMYRRLAEHNFGRDSLIVALGGGVVSDLAGFVAGTWMRGVPWAICPTTVEAMIDASIGGKTAINVPGGKNLVGAFHHPRLVLIDPTCLGTLPERDFRAGLAESIKHAAVFSPEFFAWHEQNVGTVLGRDEATLAELIERNVRIKAGVVEKDATEQSGERMLLNFGHTIGHAIEECCGYALRHGECVSLGMLAAARLSAAIGLLHVAGAQRLEQLLARFELPTRLPAAIPWLQILEVMQRDKKARAGKLQFILLQEIGKPLIRSDADELRVRQAYESLFTSS